MELPLQRVSKRALLVSILSGFALSLFVLLVSTPPAHAEGSTSCGQAVCYVDSTVRGESNWASEPYTNQDGTVNPGKGGGGSGSGGSSSGAPKSISRYTACSSWLPRGGGQNTTSYPAKGSGRYNCNFPDGGGYGSSGGTILFTCAPRGDRASNGRITYYVERVHSNGNKQWVYARYKCLYPTDAYAPIEREVSRGKVYTGGQGDFYQTLSAAQVNQATRTGQLTSSSGYVNRNVNLANPEAYVGAWQPSFTAKTGSNAAGPLYGYYRLLWVLDYRTCVKWSYPAWLNQPSRYDCSVRGQDKFVNPYTYACNQNPPLQAGVRPGALFRASDCVPGWQCVLTGDELVGGQPARLTVMRNGAQNPTVAARPSVKVTDPSRVKNTDRWQSYRSIVPGSSPASQYVKASWKWDKWQSHRPDGWVSFHWASADDKTPFSWKTRYKFTGDFLVPKQDALGGGVSYVWVPNTEECLDDTSPEVLAVRAVNR